MMRDSFLSLVLDHRLLLKCLVRYVILERSVSSSNKAPR
jgi:hypothetical protein